MSISKTFSVIGISSLLFVFAAGVSGCSSDEGSARKNKTSEESRHTMKKSMPEQMETKDSSTGQLALQTTCPVMENPVNKKLYVDHNGQRIYVCCQMCVGKVKEDPEKYIEKLKSMGQKPHPVQ